MFDFLRVDTKMGLTFSGIAQLTDDVATRERLTRSARKAYDTIVRLKKSLSLTEVEADILDRDLRRLRSELESLGEAF
jgi:predicted RNase H-like nuclease (RuvC/YqgF family)